MNGAYAYAMLSQTQSALGLVGCDAMQALVWSGLAESEQ